MLALLLGIEVITLFLGIKSFGNKNNHIDDIKLLDNKSNNLFAVMIDDGNGNYTETNSFPESGYTLNEEKSTCIDNNGNKMDLLLEFSYGIVSLNTEKTTYCYLYFDKNKNTVYDKLIDDYTNNKGVEKTTDENEKEIYYYKGSITNNNLVLNNYCWKMVRTTETDGVKLIYNGVYSNNTKCNNTGTSSQIGTSFFNNSSSNKGSPAYVGYMYNKVYPIMEQTINQDNITYFFGNYVTYSSSTGKYTLKSTKTGSWSDICSSTLSNYAYTCLGNTTSCSTVYYLLGSPISSSTHKNIRYVSLTGGANIKTAVEEMLHATNVNKTNSLVKTTIDNWYKNNMTSVTNYLENAIYCNNRTISSWGIYDPNSNTYNPNNGLSYNSSKLTCDNINDQFTLSVDNGGEEGYGNNKLIYPVGMLTMAEARLTGEKSGYIGDYLNNKGYYFLLSPVYTNGSYNVAYVLSNGQVVGMVSGLQGVRPAISLKKSIEITGGTGEIEDPYTLSLN